MALQQMKSKVQLPSIEHIERSVYVLEKGVRMPILPIRFPLDPILGLVPGAGDVLTLIISGSIIGHARKLGIPPSAQRKMMTNVLVDCIFGCVPFLGDIFDFFYKANNKNLVILKQHIQSPSQAGSQQGRRQK